MDDWYGPDDFLDYRTNDERTAAIFHHVRKAGLKFALCYEDRTIQQEIEAGFICETKAIAHAWQTMRYAQSNFFRDTCYLRWDNRPVLLNFGPQFFKQDADWQAVFSVL